MTIHFPFEKKCFTSAFVSVLVLSAMANFVHHQWAYAEYSRPPKVGEIVFADGGGYLSGFPFSMYYFAGGNPFVSEIGWSGVVANLVTAILAAFTLGWIALYLERWIRSRNAEFNR